MRLRKELVSTSSTVCTSLLMLDRTRLTGTASLLLEGKARCSMANLLSAVKPATASV